MIRVNLARNRVVDPSLAAANVTGSGDQTREGIVKIVFILLFSLGLMMYESQNIRSLNEDRARLQANVNELEARAQTKAAEVEGIKDIAKQAQELEDKLKVLKLLSKLRLREVKTLDFMQSSIPEKVWLRVVNFDAEKLNAEKGHFQFEGNAVNTEDLTEFVKRLEDSAYLEEVIVIKNQEVAGPGKSGALREYQFTADVEVKN